MWWLVIFPDAVAADVTIARTTWEAMQPLVSENERLYPWVSSRVLRVIPDGEGASMEALWWVEAPSAGWLRLPLAGEEIMVETCSFEGESIALTSEGGARVAWLHVTRPGWVRLTGRVDGSLEQGISIHLLDAPRGELRAAGLGMDGAMIQVEKDVWAGGAAEFRIGLPREPRASQGLVARGAVGVGLTVGEGELRGAAHLRWTVLRGNLGVVGFSAEGLGDDLRVEGAAVRAWHRAGDWVSVELQDAHAPQVDLALSWTRPLGSAVEEKQVLPTLRISDVVRTDRALQLARDAEVEILPALDGYRGVSAGDLPEWSRGLVEGSATAAYLASAQSPGGSLNLLRYEPAPAPALVVDLAHVDAAFSEDGHVWMRGRYELRNERAAHLRVIAPPGLIPASVRVDGESALPVLDSDGGWRIPLLRSVETVDGVLSYPVEVLWIGQLGGEWARREERSIPLPVLDAEVAVARAEIALPLGWRARMEHGKQGVVAEFSDGEGIHYGLEAGDAVVADALMRDAVEAWKDNDFDRAQFSLTLLNEMGASHQNISKLQSNLDVVEGRADATSLQSRRVKEQARARAVEDERQVEFSKRRAKTLADAGDYAGAEVALQEAIEISQEIAKLEQVEAQEITGGLRAMESDLARVREEAKAAPSSRPSAALPKKKLAQPADHGFPAGAASSTTTNRTKMLVFDEEEISGTILTPHGTAAVAVAGGPSGYAIAGGSGSSNRQKMMELDEEEISGEISSPARTRRAQGEPPRPPLPDEGELGGHLVRPEGGLTSYRRVADRNPNLPLLDLDVGQEDGPAHTGRGGAQGGDDLPAPETGRFPERSAPRTAMATAAPLVVPNLPEPAPIQTITGEVRASVGLLTTRGASAPSLFGGGSRGTADGVGGPPPPPPGRVVQEKAASIVVIAATDEGNIPKIGEVVRYQNMLVPPGTAVELPIVARGPNRRNP